MRAVASLLALALLRTSAGMVVKAVGQSGAAQAQVPNDGPIGFASLNGGTTGGAGGPVVTVTTAKAFKLALEDQLPRVVRLDGFLVDLGAIYVGDKKTILGVGSQSGFSGGSLVIKDSKNVIVRNLVMKLCQGSSDDCVSITDSKNVWVDHNDLSGNLTAPKDLYDGLVDLTRSASFVTISYNYFHDHWKATVQGGSDTIATDKTMQATMHNNYYFNIRSNAPSVRFGKAHIFNNLYENMMTAISVRMGGNVNLENDLFINVENPVIYNQSSLPGFCVMRNVDFGDQTAPACPVSKFTKIPYTYQVSPLSTLATVVRASAGVGKIST